MKNLLLLLIGCFSFIRVADAQTNNSNHFGCGTMELLEQMKQQDTSLVRRMEQMEVQIQKYVTEKKALRDHGNLRIQDNLITIPVKFHVLLNSTLQNTITDLVIDAQLATLNAHFNRQYDPNHPWQSVKATDTKIQFCKADIIKRVYTNKTYKFADSDISIDSPMDKDYLDVWILDIEDPNMPNVKGYATLPPFNINSTFDGVVIDYTVFGTYQGVDNYLNQGKVLTHEVGHWLGLYHPWSNGTSCETTTDYVDDTPQTSAPLWSSPRGSCPINSINPCTNQSYMYQNYMDYTDDVCKDMFTLGQADRMFAQFDYNGGRNNILSSPGCNPTSCPKPIGLEANFFTAGNLIFYRIFWTVPSNLNPNATFEVQWGTDPNFLSNTTTELKSYVFQTNYIQYFDIGSNNPSGLDANTNYYFRIRTICDDGNQNITWSAYSDIGTFLTPTLPAPSAPNAIVVGSLSPYNSISGATPYGSYYQGQKAQYILTRQEIYDEYVRRFFSTNPTAAPAINNFKCYLNSLYFLIKDNTGNSGTTSLTPFTDLDNLKITIKEIDPNLQEFAVTGNDMSAFDGEFMSMDGGTIVYNQNFQFPVFNQMPQGGLIRPHDFILPFSYSGTKNLLIEITFHNSNITNGVNTPVAHIETRSVILDNNNYANSVEETKKQAVIYGGDLNVAGATKGRLFEWKPIMGFHITPY